MRMEKRQSHIPIASAPRSGRIQAVFPSEKSTRNMLHPKLHGARPAMKARKIPHFRDFSGSGFSVFLSLSFRIDRTNMKRLKKKRMTRLARWITIIYSVGS